METFIVSSAHVEDLHDGRSLEPGTEVNLSADDLKEPHNTALIEDGRLTSIPETDDEREARLKKERDAAEKRRKAAAEAAKNKTGGAS